MMGLSHSRWLAWQASISALRSSFPVMSIQVVGHSMLPSGSMPSSVSQ